HGRRAKSFAGQSRSHALRIERLLSAFGTRGFHKGVQLRPRLWFGDDLLPALVTLPVEKELREVGDFGSLVFGQGFADADEFFRLRAHEGTLASGAGEFQLRQFGMPLRAAEGQLVNRECAVQGGTLSAASPERGDVSAGRRDGHAGRGALPG